ncbi:MAG TPA: TolC family protein [Planctomycetes bacterium]|nr:TolC family protein [Planctomycetota bacterium]HIK62222.1 TolC family protein [Planctomycetota bacterium]
MDWQPVSLAQNVIYPFRPMNYPLHLIVAAPFFAHALVPELAAQDGDAARVEASEPEPLRLNVSGAVTMALGSNLELALSAVQTEVSRFDELGSWGAFDWVFDATFGRQDAETKAGGFLGGGIDGAVIQSDADSLNLSFTRPLTSGGSFALAFNNRVSDSNSFLQDDPKQYTDNLNLTYSQPLMRGAWSEYATSIQRQSELAYRRQVETERQTRLGVVYQVRLAYWDLVNAIEQRGVAESGVDLGQSRLQQSERRLAAGVGTAVDVIQARVELATRHEAWIQSQHGVAQTMDILRRLIFSGKRADIWETELVPTAGLPDQVSAEGVTVLSESLAMALAERPGLRQRQMDIDVARMRLAQRISERMSGLNLSFSAAAGSVGAQSGTTFEETLDFSYPTYGANLNYSLNLGNRTASYAERSGRASVRAAIIEYDREELQVTAEVRAAQRGVHFAVEQVAATATSLELARRQLEAENARFAQDLSTTFQVLEFQHSLIEAMSNERAARAGFVKALAELDNARGVFPMPGSDS